MDRSIVIAQRGATIWGWQNGVDCLDNIFIYTEYKHKKRKKKGKKLVACNILNNTVNNLLRAKPWGGEENVNTPDLKSSNSTNRLPLPTSLGDMERQTHWPMAANINADTELWATCVYQHGESIRTCAVPGVSVLTVVRVACEKVIPSSSSSSSFILTQVTQVKRKKCKNITFIYTVWTGLYGLRHWQ